MYRTVLRRFTARRLTDFERRNLRSAGLVAPVHTAALGGHTARHPGDSRHRR
ncbi:hypothetical protein NONO_c19200 [Nocardia nova SH22a]|uniref:Uncharacterized protein n=1 Tax=Nocardia nova SH22a TaxID=1415166 RepID=W5TBH4_9NOCA|nr:hypothetical protein [Nocardia nova]AHH16720.1 hypothetical protein NONO_c19200 [Nocardia nova SH22a]